MLELFKRSKEFESALTKEQKEEYQNRLIDNFKKLSLEIDKNDEEERLKKLDGYTNWDANKNRSFQI